MPENQVQTSLVVIDKGTGPLNQIARSADNVSRSAERAKRAFTGVIPEMGKGGKGGGVIPGMGKGEEGEEAMKIAGLRVERDKFAADKEEMLLRRARMRHLRLQDGKERVFHQITGAAMMLLGSTQKGWAGEVMKAAGTTQMVGTSLFGLGGALGKLGPLLAKFGGWVGIAVGAYQVVAGAYRKIVNSIENEEKAVQHQIQLHKALAGSTTGLDRAQFNQAAELMSRMSEESKRAAQIEKQATLIPAKPLEKTGAALDRWQAAIAVMVEKSYKRDADEEKNAQNQQEYATKLQQAAERNALSTAAQSNTNLQLKEKMEQAAKEIDALPFQALRGAILQQKEKAAFVVQQMAAYGDILPEQQAAAQEMLQADLDRKNAAQSVIATMRAQDEAEQDLLFNASQLTSSLARLMPHADAAPEKWKRFNDELGILTDAYSQAAGKVDDEEFKQHVRETFKQTAMTKAQTSYDFRGSRFDIKQAFAEGFDPDRVAVAFTNDLAKISERRTMSGYSQPFAR